MAHHRHLPIWKAVLSLTFNSFQPGRLAMSLNPSKLLLAAALACTTPAWAALTANADGTVTDTSTSLVWDRCSYGLTGPACAGGSALLADWPTALTTAAAANAANYKGFNDWRVPNE
jgi:hypothetical protein